MKKIVCLGCGFLMLVFAFTAGAAVKNLKGYEPQLTGGPNYNNGGVRTAYFDSTA